MKKIFVLTFAIALLGAFVAGCSQEGGAAGETKTEGTTAGAPAPEGGAAPAAGAETKTEEGK